MQSKQRGKSIPTSWGFSLSNISFTHSAQGSQGKRGEAISGPKQGDLTHPEGDFLHRLRHAAILAALCQFCKAWAKKGKPLNASHLVLGPHAPSTLPPQLSQLMNPLASFPHYLT